MGGDGGGAAVRGDGTRALDQTPTWAVAAVCAVIVAASILLEGLLHHLGQLLSKRRKKAMFDALEKVKSELMTMGFISLLLTVTGRYVSRICIPEAAANIMLPCVQSGHSEAKEPKGQGRRHLSEDPTNLFSCPKAHLSPGTRFNFRKYIKRSLEDDFKTVVGISPPLWASALAVMLFNVHGWHNLFWFSTIPLVVILAVGTKLQAIIAMMAVEITDRHTVIQGMPVVKLSDDHFWLRKPRLVLHLIHFASFQMGSQMKRTIFDEQTAKALKKWHKAVVKKKHNKESLNDPSDTPSMDTATGGTTEESQWHRPHDVPVRHLHRYKTIAHVGGVRRSPLSDSDYSDTEDAGPLSSSSQTRRLIPPAKQRSLDADTGRTEVRVDVVDAGTAAAAAAARDVLQDSFSFQRLSPRHVQDK
nr:unnamed protein product [Digitaria exilis]